MIDDEEDWEYDCLDEHEDEEEESEDDCLAAIFAAELIILFFVISVQNPRTSFGNPALRWYLLGMVYFTFFQKNLDLSR